MSKISIDPLSVLFAFVPNSEIDRAKSNHVQNLQVFTVYMNKNMVDTRIVCLICMVIMDHARTDLGLVVSASDFGTRGPG